MKPRNQSWIKMIINPLLSLIKRRSQSSLRWNQARARGVGLWLIIKGAILNILTSPRIWTKLARCDLMKWTQRVQRCLKMTRMILQGLGKSWSNLKVTFMIIHIFHSSKSKRRNRKRSFFLKSSTVLQPKSATNLSHLKMPRILPTRISANLLKKSIWNSQLMTQRLTVTLRKIRLLKK